MFFFSSKKQNYVLNKYIFQDKNVCLNKMARLVARVYL